MAKYMLVSFKTCPWVQRAAIVLREKKIDFEFRHIEPDNRPDWFLAISPHKKVPVLRVDDKISLFESNVPTFAESVTGAGYAPTEEGYNKAIEKVPVAFERLEKALEKQGKGPFFNGEKFSLVDASYAPFLQRYYYLDRVREVCAIEKFPRVQAWAKALLARPSVHSFPEAEFEGMYREGLKRRKSWLSQFVDAAKAAAE
jgi:glutathione S-transferase